MFCTKCGAKLDDNVKFCTSCGNKIEQEAAAENAPEEATKVATENTAEMAQSVENDNSAEQIEVETGNTEAFDGETVQTDTIETKKSKKPFKIIGIAAVIIVLLSVVAGAAKNAMLYQLAPKEYAAKALSNTVDELKNGVENAGKSILGFDAANGDLTAVCNVEISDIEDDYVDYENIKVSAAASKTKKADRMKVAADLSVDSKSYRVLEIDWNNKTIDFASPALLSDTSLYIPSKTFGKEFNNSEYADYVQCPEIFEDLSASKWLNGGNDSFEKDLEKAFKKLVKSAKIKNKGKDSMLIDDKERKVNKWDMVFEDKDICDFVADVLKAADKNGWLSAINGDIDADRITEALEEAEFDDITVTCYGYKNKLMKAKVDLPNEAELYFEFTSEKDMLDNFKCGIEAQGEKIVAEMKGNLTAGEEQAKGVFTVTQKSGSDKKQLVKASVNFDFENGDYEMEFRSGSGTYSENAIEIEGKCERSKKGFKISIDDMTTTQYGYTESIKDSFGDVGDFKMEFEMMPKDNVKLSKTKKGKNILTTEADELQEIAQNAMENLSDIVGD